MENSLAPFGSSNTTIVSGHHVRVSYQATGYSQGEWIDKLCSIHSIPQRSTERTEMWAGVPEGLYEREFDKISNLTIRHIPTGLGLFCPSHPRHNEDWDPYVLSYPNSKTSLKLFFVPEVIDATCRRLKLPVPKLTDMEAFRRKYGELSWLTRVESTGRPLFARWTRDLIEIVAVQFFIANDNAGWRQGKEAFPDVISFTASALPPDLRIELVNPYAMRP